MISPIFCLQSSITKSVYKFFGVIRIICIQKNLRRKFYECPAAPSTLLCSLLMYKKVMKVVKGKVIIEKHVFIRPVDVAEYIYDKLNKFGALTKDVKEILEKIIIEMKDEKFKELDNHFGIKDP